MTKWVKIPVVFKIDRETLKKLDTFAYELGHTRSLFIRNAINRKMSDYESREREVILSLRQRTPLAPSQTEAQP